MAFCSRVTTVRARLVTDSSASGGRRQRWFRPLVIGPAVLVRTRDSHGPWQVPVTADGLLRPVVPASRSSLSRDLARLTRCGHRVRVTAAIVSPVDTFDTQNRIGRAVRPRIRTDFYGWSLLYQFPDMFGVALVDPHDHLGDLPAMYESPLELVDRAEFLAARGIVSRPLAIVTQPDDFVSDATGRLVNRFFPECALRARPRCWPA